MILWIARRLLGRWQCVATTAMVEILFFEHNFLKLFAEK
jgi:hypothetical protein